LIQDKEQMYLDFGASGVLGGRVSERGFNGREEKPRDSGEVNPVSEGMMRARKYYSQAQLLATIS